MSSLPPPPPERRRGTVLPTIVLLALTFGLVMGGYVAAANVDVPTPEPVTALPGIRFQPAPGWVVGDQRLDGPLKLVRLTNGSGNLDVFGGSAQGDPGALLDQYIRDFLQPEADQLQVASQRDEVATRSGLRGIRAHYVGVFGERSQTIEGEVTAFVMDTGVGALFDGWAAGGGLDLALEDIHAMIESTEVR